MSHDQIARLRCVAAYRGIYDLAGLGFPSLGSPPHRREQDRRYSRQLIPERMPPWPSGSAQRACPGAHAMQRRLPGRLLLTVPRRTHPKRRSVKQQEAELIAAAISSDRLAPYLARCSGDPLAAIRLYTWNIEVSAAFLGPLQCFEIVLRNAMHRELTNYLGRADWWNAGSLRLEPKGAANLRKAKQQAALLHPNPGVGHVVAELSLGFWVELLGTGRDYENRLWRPALHRSFPIYRGRRKPLHSDLRHLRWLRNRIAHCEPIHDRHLRADHSTLLRTISYISAETAACVRGCDRVPDVLLRRDAVCAGTTPAKF